MAKERSHEKTAQGLGQFLATIRTAKRLSLREVEDATGGVVSNAYLSQLENGHIAKPSPNMLYSLAEALGVSYETLMEKAGYIASTPTKNAKGRHGRVATFSSEDLTAEEEEALLEYLAFLRSKKGRS